MSNKHNLSTLLSKKLQIRNVKQMYVDSGKRTITDETRIVKALTVFREGNVEINSDKSSFSLLLTSIQINTAMLLFFV